MKPGRLWALAALLLFALARPPTPPRWRVYALQWGLSEHFGSRELLRGAPPGELRPLAWLAWLIRGPDRSILVDTGVLDPDEAFERGVSGFVPITTLLDRVHVAPQDITDIILTHTHWDHTGGLSAFPQARLWVQQRELDWAPSVASAGPPVRAEDIQEIERRVAALPSPVDGDAEVAPGVLCHLGGHHTPGTQWVEIRTGEQTIVLASDEAYLYANIEEHRATGATSDPAASLREYELMTRTASSAYLVVPGHDPQVMQRFTRVEKGVVELR